jgi:Mg-chelatase subunit ChlD
MKSNSALRGAFEEALNKASKSKANVLKTTRAAEAIEDDDLRQKLQGLQERQLQSMGPEGNWLILADRSASMSQSVEMARHIAAALAKMVKGKVWLVFFDTTPQTIDVTGLSLDVIKRATEHIRDGGNTSIGCGLRRMLDSKEIVDGIAIISDGAENTAPMFAATYREYSKFADKQVPVYLYLCRGQANNLSYSMQQSGFDMQVFDLTKGNTDYYALPDLAQTMRTNRYSLIDEVMSTKLLKLEDVFNVSRKEEATYA